jgi:hypothetical protein
MLETPKPEIDHLYKPNPRSFIEFWQKSNIAEMLKIRNQNKKNYIIRCYREVD